MTDGSPGATARSVPARVREAIADHQAASEVLIGWAQLAIFATFAVLYALSPKPYSVQPELSPEPWFLGVYLVFTLVRLWLAHTGRLPGWLLHVSVVLDMALLMLLIWSFHLKYDQPASFYLKVPTLLYAFIFIALRALRFEVWYVILAGGCAAGGWGLMVLYVVSVDPANPMITRDYVEYMTSNSVLLGAEFDKIISILMVTAVLAVAIARARRLLVDAAAEHAVATDLSRFVPSDVVRRVSSSDEPLRAGQGEVREATILFADMAGFTGVSEKLGPTELISTLNDYFEVISAPITGRGGVITQFQGDAILASFNVPHEEPDHAAQAVEAAREMQRALAGRRFGRDLMLTCRIGISTGVVVGGIVGTGDRLGYTVHGDEVNVAARLEQSNKDYGTAILVSERTARLAGIERFGLRRLGEQPVRGRSTAVVVYTLE